MNNAYLIDQARKLYQNIIENWLYDKRDNSNLIIPASLDDNIAQLLAQSPEGYQFIDYLNLTSKALDNFKSALKAYNYYSPQIENYVPVNHLFKFMGLRTGLGLGYHDARGSYKL